jgi:hypothetical protein
MAERSEEPAIASEAGGERSMSNGKEPWAKDTGEINMPSGRGDEKACPALEAFQDRHAFRSQPVSIV